MSRIGLRDRKLQYFLFYFAVILTAVLMIILLFRLTAGDVVNALHQDEELRSSRAVIIDPGHGGEDGGAVGIDGTIEKGINLSISHKLRSFFKMAGYSVIMTRSDDRAIYDKGCTTLREKKSSDLHNRFRIISDNPNAAFLSIHQNIYTDSYYSGTQVFYSPNNASSKTLAETIQLYVKSSMQPQNERLVKPAGDNLYLLYNAKSVAVMVECGFLSNNNECKLLEDNDYQDKIAFSIFCGTLQYYSAMK